MGVIPRSAKALLLAFHWLIKYAAVATPLAAVAVPQATFYFIFKE